MSSHSMNNPSGTFFAKWRNVMRPKISFILLAVTLLSACSQTRTMNGIMSSWQGSHIDEVVSQWGYPHEEKEFQGKKLYVWNYTKSAYMPQTTNTTGTVYGNTIQTRSTTTGGYMVQGSCQRILEVDDKGIVVSWQWQGGNCPFGELMEYSSWRKK